MTEVVTPYLYRVADRRRTMVLHHDKLKLCEDREIPFWIRRKRHSLGMDADSDGSEVQEEDSPAPVAQVQTHVSGAAVDHDQENGYQDSVQDGAVSTEVISDEQEGEEVAQSVQEEELSDDEETGWSLAKLFEKEVVTRAGRKIRPPAYLKDCV